MLILIIEKRVNLIRLLQKLESFYQNTVNKFDIIYYTNLLSQYDCLLVDTTKITNLLSL